ncbi:MAG TPA: recombination protein O N-terminal domain-containing protein [Candidatus Paceibacterota bacterium]|nr:recombination protein O N-terminal domain-containing protein [Candidatus Paceibacterota bacterium]
MRHKYHTRAIVLGRSPLAESAALIALLTEEFGLVRARAEGLRKPGAKLAHALQTFDLSEVTLVRGKEGWRLSGAVLEAHLFESLDAPSRSRAGRVNGLFLRLMHGEGGDATLFSLWLEFLTLLPRLSEEAQDAAECFFALRLLGHLGLDAGAVPEDNGYAPLSPEERRTLVTRINRGIAASGL